MTRTDGKLIAVAGRSRVGKSVLVSQMIADCERVLVYDSKCDALDYPGIDAIPSLSEVLTLTQLAGTGPVRARFLDTRKKYFSLFCYGCLTVARDIAPITVVVEELANVTQPGKAPEGWGDLVRMGLGYGVDIYAVTQAPQESDKTCLRNASAFICFHLQRPKDRVYMAEYMNIDVAKLDALKPLEAIATRPGESAEHLTVTP